MPRINLLLGAAGIIVFIMSGSYMSNHFPQIYQDNEKIRYLFRASHIYILFISVVNIFFFFLTTFELKKIFWLFVLSSLALMASLIMLIVEFYMVPVNQLHRSNTLYALILMLIALGSYSIYFVCGKVLTPKK